MIKDRQNIALYSAARINRDRNFDGRFFFAVKTTGVFCRPSCPSPAAKENNVIYLDTMFEAMEQGFRPCRRCRPDLNIEYHNSYIPGSEKVEKALRLIYDGFLNYKTIDELAAEVFISPRQLRKLFIESIGIPPVKIGRFHKTIFAKKLLLSSSQSITQVAFASGFRSTRQFNSSFKDILGETPSATRKNRPGAAHCTSPDTVLMLKYNKPFNFLQILSFMKPRLIAGVEKIENGKYYRTFRTQHAGGWFSVQDQADDSAIKLTINSEDVRCYMELYYRVRKMFDLDTDFTPINRQLAADPLLRQGMSVGQVPRLPTAFDPFEFAIRAVLGQQITVKAATTLAGRIAQSAGAVCSDSPEGLQYFFPTPQELSDTDISSIGITNTRQQTIRTVTDAVLDGRLSLSANQHFEAFAEAFGGLKGIGDWTVNYCAMRGLGVRDAFPAADLGIIKAMTPPDAAARPTIKQIEAAAEKWRPYRSYAALCIWNIPASQEEKE